MIISKKSIINQTSKLFSFTKCEGYFVSLIFLTKFPVMYDGAIEAHTRFDAIIEPNA